MYYTNKLHNKVINTNNNLFSMNSKVGTDGSINADKYVLAHFLFFFFFLKLYHVKRALYLHFNNITRKYILEIILSVCLFFLCAYMSSGLIREPVSL
jgi:hypothetical protein